MLDSRLRAAGATSVFLEIPWAEHAFDKVTGVYQAGSTHEEHQLAFGNCP